MASKPFDATLKDLIERYVADWPALLGPWSFRKVELIDADVSTVSAIADKVGRVQGDSFDWLLNLELQVGYDIDLPERMHLSSTLLRNRHGLMVRSVVILLRREANASTLTGKFSVQFPDEDEPYDVFRYRVIRLWESSTEALLSGGLGLLPLAPLTDDAAGRLAAVIGRIEDRLQREVPAEEADKLRTATFILLGMRYPGEVARQLFQGVTSMKESTTYQYILTEGALAEARKMITLQGRKRFSRQPDASIIAKLEAITDLDTFEELGQRLLDVSTWEDLLAPTPS
jgi:predicted transposase YdaD